MVKRHRDGNNSATKFSWYDWCSPLFLQGSILIFFVTLRRPSIPSIGIAILTIILLALAAMYAFTSVVLVKLSVKEKALGMVLWRTANGFSILYIFFGFIYWLIGTTANFGTELSPVDAVYFALGTLTTAGTGTIAPTSGLAKGLVSLQMFVDFVFIATAVTIAIARWSEKPIQRAKED